jgi:hypothetical protein
VREALADAKAGRFARVTTPDQLLMAGIFNAQMPVAGTSSAEHLPRGLQPRG